MQLLSKSEDWAKTAACEQTHDACMLTQGPLRANASGAFLNRVRFYAMSDFICVVSCPQVNCGVRLYSTAPR